MVIFGHPIVSGVMSWVYRLRRALQDYPQYQVILAQMGDIFDKSPEFDIKLTDQPEINGFLSQLGTAIIIPNWSWHVISMSCHFNRQGANIHTIAVAHSDSDAEYYNPLVWGEPGISHFVAVSPVIQEKLQRLFPERQHDISEIVYGVDVPEKLERTYSTRPIRMMYAGRIVQPQKRVFDFPFLVEELIANRVNFQFNIAGTGDATEPLRKILSDRRSRRHVSFLGRIPADQMNALWRQQDIFIQVSDYEGTSVAMLEAMGEGVIPVVTDSSSGVRSVINPGRNGFIGRVGEMEDIATFIQHMAQNPNWLPRMGQAAYETASEYALPQHAAQYIELFEHVVNTPAPVWEYGRDWVPQYTRQSYEQEDPLRRLARTATTVFSLADDELVTWSANASKQLSARNYTTTIVRHSGVDTTAQELPGLVVDCVGNLSSAATEHDVTHIYPQVYERLLPATFILNDAGSLYRVCANLTRTRGEEMRIVSYFHDDSEEQYRLAAKYDAVIQIFAVPTKTLAGKLAKLLPHRENHIVVVPYPVDVCATLERPVILEESPLRVGYVNENDSLVEALAPVVDNGQITLTGIASDDVETFGEMDVLVQPKRDLLPVLHAMAKGCVPVVLDETIFADTIQHQRNGVVASNLSDLPGLIMNLREKPKNLALMRENAHATVFNQHRMGLFASRFQDLLVRAWYEGSRVWQN